MVKLDVTFLVVAFDTTTAALTAEKIFKEQGLCGRLIPMPVEISAHCGLAWRNIPAEKDLLEQVIKKNSLEHSGLYLLEL